MNTTTKRKLAKAKAEKVIETCVIHVRISKRRDEQSSLASQERSCRAYAAAMGWRVVTVTTDDGVSAFKDDTKRPGLEEAMSYVEAGMADVLLVWKLDRLVRSVGRFHAIWTRLDKCGGQFASVTESFDTTTPSGRAMLTVTMAFAQMESEVKGERASAFHEQRYSGDGPALPPVGRVPYGFNRPAPNTLTVNPTEAAAIRKAAKMIVAGESLRAAARAINKPAPSLRVVLLSPTIYGLREIDDVCRPGNWPSILDPEMRPLFLDRFKDGTRTYGERKYLMSGFLTCGKCGGTLYGMKHTTGMRYICRFNGVGCAMSMKMTDVDEAIDAAITETLTKRAWQAMQQRQRPVGDSSMIEARLLELRDDYDSKLITRAEWLHSRTNLLAQQLDEPKARFALPPVDDVSKAWATMDLTAKQMVVQAAFDTVTVRSATDELKGRYRLAIDWRD